jgi:hypothetical protein
MSTRRSAIVVGLLIAALATWAAMASGVTGSESHGVSHALSLQDPTYAACINSGAVICNPEAHLTQVAENPVGQPPNPNAHMMSRHRAIALVRRLAAGEYTPAAPASAAVSARMMTEKGFEALQPSGVDHFANAQRLFWIVTVHAPTSATGSGRPELRRVYRANRRGDGASLSSLSWLRFCYVVVSLAALCE